MASTPRIKEPPTTTTRYEGVHQQPSYTNTEGHGRANNHGSPAPAESRVNFTRIEQFRIIAFDRALTEPFVLARAGNGAAMSAAAGEGRRK